MSTTQPLLEVRDLHVAFRSRRRPEVRAVDGVSLTVGRGEVLGILGESGSGKSTMANAILGLVRPDGGTITLDGAPVPGASRAARQQLARRVQVVFQDPFGSMNPARTVGDTLAESLRFNLRLAPGEIAARVDEAVRVVGLDPAVLDRFPPQFSGGQLQRLAIARALVVEPELVICDEPVSALDLSVQAQVVNLLARLSRELGLAYLFISHDTVVVRHLSDRIVVLYAGKVVEEGPAEAVADTPSHPYTRALVLAAPAPDPERQAERRRLRRAARSLDAVPPGEPGVGCAYRHRCPHATDLCAREVPELRAHGGSTLVACHHAEDIGSVQLAPAGASSAGAGPAQEHP